MAKKNGFKNGLLMQLLVPILIIVLIASAFYAVIDGIIGIISGVLGKIANVFKHPIESLKRVGAQFANNWADFWGLDYFNENAYNDKRLEAKVIIDIAKFEDMKNSLSTGIDLKKTGLDDLTIKKMLLTYYRTTYLEDVQILIELTDDEYEMPDDELKPFKKDKVKPTDGSDELPYLITNGCMSITADYVGENGASKNVKMLCFTKEGLNEMYKNEYVNGDDSKKNAVMEALKTCYTLGDDGRINMLSFSPEKITETYSYADGKASYENESYSDASAPQYLSLDYNNNISMYVVPVEFMVDLMEITGSKEFINEFMKLIDDTYEIKLKVYPVQSTTVTTTEVEYNKEVVLLGETGNYKVKKDDGTEVSYTIEENLENNDKIDIVVKYSDINEECKLTLYKNGKKEKSSKTISEIDSTIKWEKLEKTDIKDVEESIIQTETYKKVSTVTELRYDLGIESVKTWIAVANQGSNINTETSLATYDENGEEVTIEDISEAKQRNLKSTNATMYAQKDRPEIFEKNNSKKSDSYDEYISTIYNNAVSDTDMDAEWTRMAVHDTDQKEKITIERNYEKIVTRASQNSDNTDVFLALLSNKTGKKDDKDFVPPSKGGKVVEYEDIYGGEKTKVGDLLVNGAKMLFELLDSTYTEEKISNTAGLSKVMRYVLWKYSGNNYGVTDWEYLGFDLQSVTNGSAGINVNSVNIGRDEFIKAVQEYSGNEDYQNRFGQYAGKIYDICKSKNINPIMCVAQAGLESQFGKYVPTNSKWNYWGLGVYNDSNVGTQFNTLDDAINYYCDTILGYQKPGSIAYSTAQKYAPYNDKITGNMSSIYDILSCYMYLGDYHSGTIWGDINVKEYLTDYMKFPCTHSVNEPTTVEEQAAYVVDYIDNKVIKIAKEVFGEGILIQNDGAFYGEIEIYNSDGTVNSSKMEELDSYLTSNLLNTTHHWRDSSNHQSGPFAKWWTNNGLSNFQCTWWANGRASQYLELNGTKYKKYPTTYGHGGDYYSVNIDNGYFNYGTTPKKNSIISWKKGRYGHVAYVEAVEPNGDIWISHAGGGQSWFGVAKCTKDSGYAPTNGNGYWSGYTLNGFIYLDEPK